MGVLCFKSGHHAEICWLSPKNDLNSVLVAGSGKALIASSSSGSGLISTSPPTRVHHEPSELHLGPVPHLAPGKREPVCPRPGHDLLPDLHGGLLVNALYQHVVTNLATLIPSSAASDL